VLALAGIAASFVFGDYDSAESNLKSFYSEMAKADFASANRSINEAIRLWPSNARYHSWRGYALSQNLPSQCPAPDSKTREAAAQAIAEYRRALQLNPRDSVAHHNLGWLDHLLGNNQEAQHEFTQAVTLDPDTAIYHLSLGLFLQEFGDSETANRQYLAALELSPAILDSPFFTRYRARFPERAQALVTEATTQTETHLGNSNDPILKARLGKFYLYHADFPRAAELLRSSVQDLPNLPMVWFNLGEVRRLQGNRDEAWACYQKARFLDGSLSAPLLRMGEMYREAGRRNEAIGDLRSAEQKWAHINPVTAGHNTRLYGGISQPIDDLLPTTLVWYTSPCEASEAYRALSELFPDNKMYAARSRTCEDLPDPHQEKNP
jgi:tetratricopeptide (TPR) repeat protein